MFNKQSNSFLQLGLITFLSIANPVSTSAQSVSPSSANQDFSRLQQVLTTYGFQVNLAIPPVRGTYGIFQVDSKQVWINPVVFDLGIAVPTLVHESIHAAQFCAGGDRLQLLDLDLEPSPRARPYFLRYHAYRREIEAQAYTVQTQPNRVELAIAILHQYCKK
ncbi:MAG: hypothetical protein SAJ37_01095 [Oscillatoria sp. PMC 1068.18]|nr:hypothetical protein [Oscillatoria sp. PMC 1076.18]MEC4987318.1 hypothetical protein [Oscillatoria sp. PMC 1068.18]